MKLNINRPGRGAFWVRQGIRTFFRQPFALSGLFLLFMAALFLLAVLPLIGSLLGLILLPTATLGMMVATQLAEQRKFPMPKVLLAGFLRDASTRKQMLLLGVIYAAGLLLVMACSALVDGGQFAKLYLIGGDISEDLVLSPNFDLAILLAMILYTPLSMMFWHAPALVYWQKMNAQKSIFISLVACWRNLGAFTVFSITWMGVFIGISIVAALLVSPFGDEKLMATILMPVGMMVAAMFFTSIHYTVIDCFTQEESDDPAP